MTSCYLALVAGMEVYVPNRQQSHEEETDVMGLLLQQMNHPGSLWASFTELKTWFVSSSGVVPSLGYEDTD